MNRFDQLLEAFVQGTISKMDQQELFNMLASDQYNTELSSRLDNDIANNEFDTEADLPPHIAHEIVRKIMTSEKKSQELIPRSVHIRRRNYWFAAAAGFLIILLSGALYLTGNRAKGFAAMIPDKLEIHKNVTANTRSYNLPDGSTVMLEPGSAIHYSPTFTANMREVFLEGEAFFDVKSDRERPFYVYYDDVITKVLGTSFAVGTNEKTGNVEVAVMKGKVQVISNKDFVRATSPLSPGIIVTPNQKAIYKQQSASFEATIVEKPVVLYGSDVDGPYEDEAPPAFVYQSKKLSEIYNDLERSYGIDIVAENDNLQDCVFTGDVSEQDLYNKLSIICTSTGSSYEVHGTRILIKGRGCD